MATYITVIGIPTSVQRIELNKAVCATKAGKGTYFIFEPIYYELSTYHLFSSLHMYPHPPNLLRYNGKNKC